ncbi:MAG TPA: restriction endonuclease subunit S [Bacillota bacterium]|nr:restriction endonuclease subunit S [Bacillota bacterium]HPQ61726.1 restriction endonuclease subunit S [Bacillota bacterium]HRX91287.1 restriction endonuclease subunit S [Candidatus Izemoplasmatales bacterium]
MSKIVELIKDYCPTGVQKKSLAEIGVILGGMSGKSKDDFAGGNSKYITYMNIYKNPKTDLNVIDYVNIKENENQHQLKKGDVLFTGSSETPDECGISSVVCDEVLEPIYLNSFSFIFRTEEGIFNPHFLKHLFRSYEIRNQIGKTANGVTRYNVSKKLFAKVEIPIPPMEVQNEIARILDNFSELEVELEAELEARTKQYEYYRNKLLDFSTGSVGVPRIDVMLADLCPMGVELRTIEDVGTYRRGSFPQPYGLAKWYDDENGMPFVQVVDVENDKFLLTPDTRRKISIEAQKMSVFAPIGTLIVTIQGTIGRVAITQYEAYIDRTLLVFKETDKNINKKFLAYVLKQKFALEEKTARGSTLKTITKEELKNFLIPIPPLEIQEEIVRILDTFSEYVTSISQGLPAEIAARRKQYEYYRNKLLTF